MEVKVNLVRWTGKWQTQEGNTGAKVLFPNCARIQEKNFALQQRLLLLKIMMKKNRLTRALIPELTLHTRLDSGWPPRHSFPWPERRAIPAAKR